MPRESFEVPCTVRVVNTFESLEAHVELPDDVAIEPGDEVCVLGDRIDVPFGQSVVLERMATVTRAGSRCAAPSFSTMTWSYQAASASGMTSCSVIIAASAAFLGRTGMSRLLRLASIALVRRPPAWR